MALPMEAPSWMRQQERIPTEIFSDSELASQFVAETIAALIRQRQAEGRPCVLGLATGSTVQHVYQRLVKFHREGLSFANVITFNLDEYYPMEPSELQSYHRFMHEQLFDHVDIPPGHWHLPRGNLNGREEIQIHCELYEEAIREAGGIDLQLLGIGRGGHIGFNERGSDADTRTRLVLLAETTRTDAASDFFKRDFAPRQAVTMGIATILSAKRILLIAFGESKAAAVATAVEGPESDLCPASYLQRHSRATLIADPAAAAQLTRTACPWILSGSEVMDWTAPRLGRQATVWLSTLVKRPIVCLTEEDFANNRLQGLLAAFEYHAESVNQKTLEELQAAFTRLPANKMDASNTNNVSHAWQPSSLPEHARRRCLVLSPHPDDDVISLGGTLKLLCSQGHEVFVAYQTSGAIAVKDEDLIDRLEFARGVSQLMENSRDITAETIADQSGVLHNAFANGGSIKASSSRPSSSDVKNDLDSGSSTSSVVETLRDLLAQKPAGHPDPRPVQRAKALVRRCEAQSAAGVCGVPNSRVRFLDLPFYETGEIIKAPLSDRDVDIVQQLLEETQPDVIFAAGDLSDPHGTHRTCLVALLRALDRVHLTTSWYKERGGTKLLLYRGAWQEWALHEADLFLCPSRLRRCIPRSKPYSDINRKKIHRFSQAWMDASFGSEQRIAMRARRDCWRKWDSRQQPGSKHLWCANHLIKKTALGVY